MIPNAPFASLAPRRIERLAASAALWILVGLAPAPQALSAPPPPIDAETAATLVAAVEAASALDQYNARCRSDVSGRHTDNLNKELVGKLRITVISVQDDHFPEHSYRRAQTRLQEQFLEVLRQAGGCKGAKDSSLPQTLRDRYRAALDAIKALP